MEHGQHSRAIKRLDVHQLRPDGLSAGSTGVNARHPLVFISSDGRASHSYRRVQRFLVVVGEQRDKWKRFLHSGLNDHRIQPELVYVIVGSE